MTTEFEVVRIFDHPRELVFECLTDPHHLAEFWGPAGTTTPLADITVDLRTGGVFETVMVDDATGHRHRTRFVFTRVEPPETIGWEDIDNGMTSITTLTALSEGRTEMRIHHTKAPDAFATAEAQAGFATSIDRLAAYLATVDS